MANDLIRKKWGLFNPASKEPHKISRSKIDMFMGCPRCFYLDQRLGVKRPSMPAFTLNSAVDYLLKKEFDLYRTEGRSHPLMEKYGIKAVPFRHADLEKWRHNFTGVRYLHEATNLLVFGAVDDVWVDSGDELYVVDYKATAKDGEVAELNDTEWHNQYRRQMEIYQWLLRRNGFKVSNRGYFVYANGQKDRKDFAGRLEFDIRVIPYDGEDSWLEGVLFSIKECLTGDKIPAVGERCEHCSYRKAAGEVIRDVFKKEIKPKKNDAVLPKLKSKEDDDQTKPLF